MYCLYQTVNLLNSRYYIGVHQDSKNAKYLGSGKALRAAIKMYGRKNFRKDILVECETADFAYILEAAVVTPEFIALTTNYNLCPGGVGGVGGMAVGKPCPRKGQKRPIEDCQKISAGQMGRVHSAETRKRMSDTAFKRSDDYRNRLSATQVARHKRRRESLLPGQKYYGSPILSASN